MITIEHLVSSLFSAWLALSMMALSRYIERRTLSIWLLGLTLLALIVHFVSADHGIAESSLALDYDKYRHICFVFTLLYWLLENG